MAEKLKDFFNERVVKSIAEDVRRVFPRFNARAFIQDCLDGLEDKELIARGAHLAEGLRRHLPDDFPKASRILVDSLGPEHQGSDTFGMAPFRYLPHLVYVSRYGLGHFEESMHAQYELTKRFTAENSIRSFLIQHPKETYRRLETWAADPNVHVRRLVSEGTRPRLPWAPRLREFQKDPGPVIALLERLKDDPERYVQRSVANNLNDIGKDHPDRAIDTCRRWLEAPTPGREWIVKHALRSLVKKGNRKALALFGVAAKPRIRIGGVAFEPNRIRIGGALRVSFEMKSLAKKNQALLVDYAVHFVKASGDRRAKVFKLRRVSLDQGAQVRLEARVSFADMTTRQHYPGKHALDVLVNGVSFPLGEFDVRR